MQKVAVIVDSIACLPREMAAQYEVKILPLNFYFRDKIYRDWVDVTPSEAYEMFLQDPSAFKTSAVSPGECLEAYREAGKGSDKIFCLTVSSKISAVHKSATEAKELFRAENPRIEVEVMDSETVSAAEGFIALAAARAAREGKSLAEVSRIAREVKDRVRLYILLDTVRHVYRSGRIPRIAAEVGSILNIKPILTIMSGVLRFVCIVRSKRRGIGRLLNIMKEKVGQKPVYVTVTHAYDFEEAARLKELIAAEFNCAELWVSEFSPLMGYACGTGAVGIAFYTDE